MDLSPSEEALARIRELETQLAMAEDARRSAFNLWANDEAARAHWMADKDAVFRQGQEYMRDKCARWAETGLLVTSQSRLRMAAEIRAIPIEGHFSPHTEQSKDYTK